MKRKHIGIISRSSALFFVMECQNKISKFYHSKRHQRKKVLKKKKNKIHKVEENIKLNVERSFRYPKIRISFTEELDFLNTELELE